jgi:drug/metabolite transporter (DMT)-like permease
MAKMEKRVLMTAVMTGWLALSVIFAGIFIIEKHIHNHTGDRCRICLEINIAQRIVDAGLKLAALCFLACFFVFVPFARKAPARFFLKSPLELKVRFNC